MIDFKEEKGFVMPTVILVLMVTSLLSATMSMKINTTMLDYYKTKNLNQAKLTAKAGVEKAIKTINDEIEGDGFTPSDLATTGTIEGDRYNLSISLPNAENVYTLEAIGIVDEGLKNEVQEKLKAKIVVNTDILGAKNVILKELN